RNPVSRPPIVRLVGVLVAPVIRLDETLRGLLLVLAGRSLIEPALPPLHGFLLGHELAVSKLRRSLERHAGAAVPHALKVRIAPRRLRHRLGSLFRAGRLPLRRDPEPRNRQRDRQQRDSYDESILHLTPPGGASRHPRSRSTVSVPPTIIGDRSPPRNKNPACDGKHGQLRRSSRPAARSCGTVDFHRFRREPSLPIKTLARLQRGF